jgi:hypothetical protein
MPKGDRTGPMGMGMQTGRGAGYCGGLDRPGYSAVGFGWRNGMGFGCGRGMRSAGPRRGIGVVFDRLICSGWRGGLRMRGDVPFYGNPDPETEKRLLARQAEDLQIELDTIRKRLGEIEAVPPSS